MEILGKYQIENKDELYLDQRTDKMNIIKSISFNQQEIINNIIELHIPLKIIEVDVTFGRGLFYKNDKVKLPPFRYDIEPRTPGIVKCDCRNLPLKDSSINSLIMDPPFLATTGKSLKIDDESNKINKHFGVYPSEKELFQFYVDSLKEFYRVLKDKGILIFKIQDKVSGGKQYFSHTFIQNEAEKIGFYSKDLFILLARNRIVADWQRKNQQHARKHHCYFLVFQKIKCKVNYNL